MYAQTVDSMHEDYIKPQENSSHAGCRYVTVSDGAYALTAASETPFSFNVSPYTQEEMCIRDRLYPLRRGERSRIRLLLPGDFPKRHLGFPVFQLL